MILGQLTAFLALVILTFLMTSSLVDTVTAREIILNFALPDMKLKSDIIIVLDDIPASHRCAVSCMFWSEPHQKRCQSINYNAALRKCELLSGNTGRYISEMFQQQPGWEHFGQKLEREFKCLKKDDTMSCCLPRPGSTVCYLPSSCQEIKSQCQHCQSNYYSVRSAGGIPSTVFCPFEGEKNCKEIKQSCPTCRSGFYSASFNDGQVDVYCDMDVDQGGWMMVGNFTITDENKLFTATDVAKATIPVAMTSIRNGQSSVLTIGQLQQLMSQNKFTEFRIKCRKPSVGRNLDIVLFQEDFIRSLLYENVPPLIDITRGVHYRALRDDESLIGGSATALSYDNFYSHSIFTPNQAHVQIDSTSRLECDDFRGVNNNKNVGHWEFFVR